MKKNDATHFDPMSRASFLKKSGKIGALCLLCPTLSQSLVSCGSDDSASSSEASSEEIGTCSFHGAVFNGDGLGVSGPASGQSLKSYPTSLDGNNLSVTVNSNTVAVDLDSSDFSSLKTTSAVLAVDEGALNHLPTGGLLFYRKSASQVVALSRVCPHQGGTINKNS